MNIFKATNGTMTSACFFAMAIAVVAPVWIAIGYVLFGYYGYSYWPLVSLVLWQVFNVVGVAAGAHRYFSHRAFECNVFWQWVMAYFCTVSLVGPPSIWATAHRVHHAKSDTEEDPYNAYKFGRDGYMSHTTSVGIKSLMSSVRGSTLHLTTLKYFWLFPLSWLALSALAGHMIGFVETDGYFMNWYDGVVLFWLIPAGLTQLTLRLVLWTGHVKGLGYRNHNTNDDSNNFWFMSLIAAGEGWHNNHHHDQRSPCTKEKWWEIDITWWFIKLIRKHPSGEKGHV